MGVILRTEDLCKFYGEGDSEVRAVDKVNLEIMHGEFVAVVGRRGSGKSTLLYMLGGLERPTSGKVLIKDVDIYRPSEDALTVFRRRKLGFIFQSSNLISSMNVWENIVLPLGLDHKKIDEAFAGQIIDTLGLRDRLEHLPDMLSEEQRQKAAIARALVTRPDIIFADEPTGNLDSKASDEVITLLKMSVRRFGQTLVMMTHDEDIAQMADRLIMIEDGRVVAS